MKNFDTNFYKQEILKYIPSEPIGRHHKEIAEAVGLRDYTTRKLIRLLREDGYAICSSAEKGYWMARNEQEVQDVINMFNSYICSMINTVNALQITKESMQKEK